MMKKSLAMTAVLVALAGAAVGVEVPAAAHQPAHERVKPEERNAAIRYLWGASLIPANFADLCCGRLRRRGLHGGAGSAEV